MKNILLILITFLMFSCGKQSIRISNISERNAGNLAVNELCKYFNQVYPNVKFESVSNDPGADIQLLLNDEAREMGLTELPAERESYLISNTNNTLYIISPDERGLLNAVYALLEKHGCGFYLSKDVIPNNKKWKGLKESSFRDKPLVENRFLFNWHNFLSGCTGWNIEDWQKWIDQANKMRYNGIMVHAYGNNPMFSFEYLGKKKQTGYLNNTASGRDWGNQHVNDVRRITGGEIFNEAVFGAKASFAPEKSKDKEATALMQQVFNYAEDRGTKIIFALDFDTWMANPQEIIRQLPKESIFEIDGYVTPNPEHPEGYKYYKHILKSLVEMYPQIDQLSVWHRAPKKKAIHGSIWLNIQYAQFPENWKKEYQQKMKENPQFNDDQLSVGMFAHSKLIGAILKARDEVKPELEISSGSWRFEFVPYANVFYPKEVSLIPLDWEVVFNTSESVAILSEAGKNREVFPVIWAHHDDHRYIGRPYKPWDNLFNRLNQTNSSGFGIIHWTTRPLDLYFANSAHQVWEKSANETLEQTVQQFVQKLIGSRSEKLSKYFYLWVTEGPMFGRETSDNFVDLGKQKLGHSLESWSEMETKAKERLELLNAIPELEHNKYLKYQKTMEEFYLSFFVNQQRFSKAFQLASKNKIEEARELMHKTNPEETIEKYVDACNTIGFTSGEKALVFSLNTRWKIDYTNLRQRLGMEPVRYLFSPTQHDPLAQGPGQYTYFINEDKHWYRCLWEEELKHGTFEVDNGLSYLKLTQNYIFSLKTIHGNGIPDEFTVNIVFDYMGEKTQVEVIQNSKISYGKHNEIVFECKNDNLSISPNGNELRIYEIIVSQRKG